jgi:hypothetical protein
MNMQFELYDMTSIIDGSLKCPCVLKPENATEDDQKSSLVWKRDNTQRAALNTIALT